MEKIATWGDVPLNSGKTIRISSPSFEIFFFCIICHRYENCCIFLIIFSSCRGILNDVEKAMASSDLDSVFDEINELKELFERCGMRDTMFSHYVSLEDIGEMPFLLAILVLNHLPKLSYSKSLGKQRRKCFNVK